MLASKAPSCVDIARDAAMGRVYLVLAHQAAKIDATTPERSFWDLPLSRAAGRLSKVPEMEPN
jgi:hypothetical protein